LRRPRTKSTTKAHVNSKQHAAPAAMPPTIAESSVDPFFAVVSNPLLTSTSSDALSGAAVALLPVASGDSVV
jgi:hypothetical protein